MKEERKKEVSKPLIKQLIKINELLKFCFSSISWSEKYFVSDSYADSQVKSLFHYLPRCNDDPRNSSVHMYTPLQKYSLRSFL